MCPEVGLPGESRVHQACIVINHHDSTPCQSDLQRCQLKTGLSPLVLRIPCLLYTANYSPTLKVRIVLNNSNSLTVQSRHLVQNLWWLLNCELLWNKINNFSPPYNSTDKHPHSGWKSWGLTRNDWTKGRLKSSRAQTKSCNSVSDPWWSGWAPKDWGSSTLYFVVCTVYSLSLSLAPSMTTVIERKLHGEKWFSLADILGSWHLQYPGVLITTAM